MHGSANRVSTCILRFDLLRAANHTLTFADDSRATYEETQTYTSIQSTSTDDGKQQGQDNLADAGQDGQRQEGFAPKVTEGEAGRQGRLEDEAGQRWQEGAAQDRGGAEWVVLRCRPWATADVLSRGQTVNRLLYFVREMDPSKEALTKSELHDLARRFLARLDYEITKEQKERRQGRPKSKRHEELDAVKAREQIEYDTEGLGESKVPMPTVDKHAVEVSRIPADVTTWSLSRCYTISVLLDLTDKDSVASARHWNDNLNGKSGYLT